MGNEEYTHVESFPAIPLGESEAVWRNCASSSKLLASSFFHPSRGLRSFPNAECLFLLEI